MQYFYDGKFYKIVKISGPQHNMLALAFGESNLDIEVTDLEESSDKTLVSISQSDVKNQVLFAVEEANKELGTNYAVIKIQFVSSDSPSKSIYVELTKQILKRLKSDGAFIRI